MMIKYKSPARDRRCTCDQGGPASRGFEPLQQSGDLTISACSGSQTRERAEPGRRSTWCCAGSRPQAGSATSPSPPLFRRPLNIGSLVTCVTCLRLLPPGLPGRAVAYARSKGMVVVAAAGNDAINLDDPKTDSKSPDNIKNPILNRPITAKVGGRLLSGPNVIEVCRGKSC